MLAPGLQKFFWSGAYVGTVVPPQATTILNAPQYLTGKVLGDEAAKYIRARLGGKAKVVLLTHDSLQFLAPRFAAMRNSLKSMSGAVIVADISPLTVDEAGGADMMRKILLAEPNVDVVLGADTVVLGHLKFCGKRARPVILSFLVELTENPQQWTKSNAVASIRPASAWPRQSLATRWASTPRTGSRVKAFHKQWTYCRRLLQPTTSHNMRLIPPILPLSIMMSADAKDTCGCMGTSATIRAINT